MQDVVSNTADCLKKMGCMFITSAMNASNFVLGGHDSLHGVVKKEVKNWLEQAEHDIEVAEYNLKGNMLDAAAFYSQQAAEKALRCKGGIGMGEEESKLVKALKGFK